MNDIHIISDLPINEKTEDRFSRCRFSEGVAEVISRRSDPSGIVIGLHGVWGSGKTSVLNLIEKSLETDENVICIQFNPWRIGKEDELLIGCFENIAKALNRNLFGVWDCLKKIIKTILPLCKTTGEVISSFIPDTGIVDLRNRVEKGLEKSKKRILILIDDIDRLEKNEIHALFKLVKLTADFRYVSYILAFDKDIVAASLQDRYPGSGENSGESFLEKIIQIPLNLPAIESHVLTDFCYQGVNEAVDISGISLNEQHEQEFARNFSLAYSDCLATPRKAKLYGNILMFSLPILKDEVNPIDLMLLEGIRVFCPPLYEMLRDNKALFTVSSTIGYHLLDEANKKEMRERLDNVLDQGRIINKDGFISLLKYMFPKLEFVYGNKEYSSTWIKSWNNGKRICSENYYARYFTYGIPIGDISDEDIQRLPNDCQKWLESCDSTKNPLIEYLDTSLVETLVGKLRNIAGEVDADASYALAVAVAQKSDVIPNYESPFSFLATFSQAVILVSDLIQNIPRPDRIDSVKRVIDSAATLKFKFEIIRWLKKEDENRPDIDGFSEDSIDDIGRYLGKFLDDQVKGGLDITIQESDCIGDFFFTLNYYVRNGYVNDYMKGMISNNPEFLVRVLSAYVPTRWKIESGVSNKSDFGRDQYNSLVQRLDASIIVNAIQEHFPEAMNISDDFPSVDSDNMANGIELLKQFVWFYSNPMPESDSD